MIPPNVKTIIKAGSAQAHVAQSKTQRANIQSAAHVGRVIVNKNMDEMTPARARAVDKVLALP